MHQPDLERQLALWRPHDGEDGSRGVPGERHPQLGAEAALEELERDEQPTIDDGWRLRQRLDLRSGGERRASRHEDEQRLADRQAVALSEGADIEPPPEPADDRLELDEQPRRGRAESERRRGAAHHQAAGAGAGEHHCRGGGGFGGIFLCGENAGSEQQKAGEQMGEQAEFHRSRQ